MSRDGKPRASATKGHGIVHILSGNINPLDQSAYRTQVRDSMFHSKGVYFSRVGYVSPVLKCMTWEVTTSTRRQGVMFVDFGANTLPTYCAFVLAY